MFCEACQPCVELDPAEVQRWSRAATCVWSMCANRPSTGRSASTARCACRCRASTPRRCRTGATVGGVPLPQRQALGDGGDAVPARRHRRGAQHARRPRGLEGRRPADAARLRERHHARPGGFAASCSPCWAPPRPRESDFHGQGSSRSPTRRRCSRRWRAATSCRRARASAARWSTLSVRDGDEVTAGADDRRRRRREAATAAPLAGRADRRAAGAAGAGAGGSGPRRDAGAQRRRLPPAARSGAHRGRCGDQRARRPHRRARRGGAADERGRGAGAHRRARAAGAGDRRARCCCRASRWRASRKRISCCA